MATSSTKKSKQMSSSYTEILAQIKELQEKAEELRKAELAEVVADIKAKISQYGITAQELGFTVFPINNKFNPTPTKTSSVAPKYQNSDGSLTWSGRGIKPKWVEAHLNAGGSLDDLLINH